MRRIRMVLCALVIAAAGAGVAALYSTPALAAPPDFCPQPAGPVIPCINCPTFVDPVACTVICAGGPTQKTFSNQCFAGCSGFIIQGECTRTGG